MVSGKTRLNTFPNYAVCGIRCLAVLLGVVMQLHAEDSVKTARLKFVNIPPGVELIINRLICTPDEHGVVPVVTGPVLLEIKRERVVLYSAFFMMDSGAVTTVPFSCSEECALLHVLTEPLGAVLSMDGLILGQTPYMNRFIKPGNYSIMATKPGYIPVIRRIEITPQSDIESYVMEQTRALKDSLLGVENALHRRRQQTRGVLFAAAAIGMIAGAFYYDVKSLSYQEKMDEAADAYDAASSYEECQRQKSVYYNNRGSMVKPIRIRNAFYGVAGACLAGFYCSFIF